MAEEDYYYEDLYSDEDLSHLSLCILPVIAQVTAVFLKIFGLSAVVSIVAQLRWDSLTLVTDLVLGVLCGYLFYERSLLYLMLLVLVSYIVLVLFAHKGRCGIAMLISNLTLVFLCEFALVDPEQWHQIRGSAMLLMMKCTSVGFDVDAGVVSPPGLLLFAGYTLSPVSLIFGPFVPLPEYRKSKRCEFGWVVFQRICTSLFLAYLTVLISTCLLPTLADSVENKLIRSYFIAQSFRTSHYFVSYTSQVSSLIGGLQHSPENFNVVKPSKIEIPSSMAAVAVAWNLPMHCWLKTYVYKKSRTFGQFIAALLTYAASSILHGMNFQLPAVLISIFIFSYVEAEFRKELSLALDSDVGISKNRERVFYNSVLEVPVKLFFLVLNMAQLAYLGVTFDLDPSQVEGYAWTNTLGKWSALGWYGHLICVAGVLGLGVLRFVNGRSKVKGE